jgi:hypothetical protein
MVQMVLKDHLVQMVLKDHLDPKGQPEHSHLDTVRSI